MKYLILIAFVFFVQAALSAPQQKKSQVQQKVEKSQLEELAAQAQKTLDGVKAQLEKDFPDSNKVVEIINKQTQEAANLFKQISKKIDAEVKAHKPEVDDMLKKASANINEASLKLQEAVGPETTAKAKDLTAKLESGLKTFYTEFDKIVKASEPDMKKAQSDFNAFTKSALESFVNFGKTVQEQVKTAVADHEKTHKHK